MRWYERIAQWSERRGWSRDIPDHTDRTKTYMKRYGLFGDPKIEHKWFAVYIHHILMSDDDCLHSHPQPYFAVVLNGAYDEYTRRGIYRRRVGSIRFRSATSWHRLEAKTKSIWTLFIALPRLHKWFFLVNNRPVYYKKHLGLL